MQNLDKLNVLYNLVKIKVGTKTTKKKTKTNEEDEKCLYYDDLYSTLVVGRFSV